MKPWQILPILFAVLVCGILPAAQAETFLLTNGDRISGNLIEKKTHFFVIDTPSMGKVSLNREFIQETEKPKPPKNPELWTGKVNGGYALQEGNTQTQNLSGGLAIKRKEEKVNEFDVKAESLYGEVNRQMNVQKYNGMSRFAYSFGDSKKWYNFYKLEGDHNRFANINARFTPSTGIGYWFSDSEDWKLMSEFGGGVTYTDYRTERKNDTELVLIPRLFAEKRLLGQSRISEEVTAYPSLTNRGEYRLRSETIFTNPISEKLRLKITWLNEYNSAPGAGIKKQDSSLVSSLEYLF